MTITLYFGRHNATTTSVTIWTTLAPTVASAVLAALFQRFPDTIQNIKQDDAMHVVLRTRHEMPPEWCDGSVIRGGIQGS